jgi:hypothetical protein
MEGCELIPLPHANIMQEHNQYYEVDDIDKMEEGTLREDYK